MLTLILVLIVIFFLARSILSDISVTNPFGAKEKEDETIIEGKFTPLTLAKYNGKDSPKVFIAVRKRVFDVSQGSSFYGPGGPYANFAGRDASRGLALNSFDIACLTPITEPIDDLADLTAPEIESLDHWEEHFENKYPVVGTLSENEKA
ncbi:cytochrome b5-like heme/steroid binding domain-containing protein [Scheffersomyces xylosifermentans]|uniref:cytochrome b5-like heme/steroid binding domain-containing protein n=1 Tax=Scheffersomyces xylosifermentans TaxID=1304137 RepID=UPI00315D11A1